MQKITKQELDKTYPLSPIQQGLLFSSSSGISGINYIMQSIFLIQGRINIDILKNTIYKLQEEAEILRTSIGINTSGEYVQWISEELLPVAAFHEKKDISECGFYNLLEEFRGYVNLSENKLFRTDFIRVSENEIKMVWTYHHIILDSISIDHLSSRFGKIYGQLEMGLDVSLKEACSETSFRDYVKWLETCDNDSAKRYWKKLLDEYDTIADIRPLMGKGRKPDNKSVSHMTIPEELTVKLVKMSEMADHSLEDILQAAWIVLLQNYCYSDDLVFGRVYHGRPSHMKGSEKLEGVFVTTMPVRGTVLKGQTIKDLILRLNEQRKKSDDYSYCPLAEIFSVTAQKKELIKTLFMYEEKHESLSLQPLGKKGIRIQKELPVYRTEYEIAASILFDGKNLHINLFGDGRYSQYEQDLILNRFEKILNIFTENISACVSDIDISLEEEREQICNVFNNTDVEMDMCKTIAEVFEEQVKLTPDQTAIVFEEKKLTYRELNEMSNRLAHKLRDMGVGPDDFVVIMAKRSIEQIAAVLAVLKAGGAYVPVSGEYPQKRKQYMINDCQPKVILKHGYEVESCYPDIDLGDKKTWFGNPNNPNHTCNSENLCYIIYTSGTTGNPKGVMVMHKGVISLRKYLIDLYEITVSDKILQFADLVFDVSVWEISMSLLSGAALVMIPEHTIADVERFNQFVVDCNITVAILPPLYLMNAEVKNLRSLTTGGSASFSEVVKRALGNKRYVNAYGPTEITVQATHWEYDFLKPVPDSIPIGKPIYNTKTYIMNHGKICGIGMPGVLYIAGVGVTKGYLNLPELTAEKFIPNPFGEGLLYDSGDLVRWLPDGNIDFLGRVDGQVKIRGYRIELDEISVHVRNTSNVKDAAVIVCEDGSGDPALFAYIVSEQKENIDKIKNELRNDLPEYMIPAYIIQIDEIPLTKGGKLDIKALPEINPKTAAEYAAPKNEAEEALCVAFQTVLCVETVGLKDNFFELGGDSIKALRIVSQLNKLGYQVSAAVIMKKVVVGAIAALVSEIEKVTYEQGDVTGYVTPTPIMRFFEDWNFTDKNHFNQDMLLDLMPGDEPFIPEVLHKIVCHHDILRLQYENSLLRIFDSSYADRFYRYMNFDIRGCGDENVKIETEADKMHASLDLLHGPIMNAAVFSSDEGSKLFICIHHLAVDVVSWHILANDIMLAIQQKRAGRCIVLPRKTASFIEWSQLLKEYAGEIKVQQAYWKRIADDLQDGTLRIGTGNGKGYETIQVMQKKSVTGKILKNVGEPFHADTRCLLISALVIAVKRMTGQDLLTLCMEGHGREELHKKISVDNTVGWFTSIFPVLFRCTESLEDAIVWTKEALKKVPDHGIGYGLLHQKLDVNDPAIFFNYLGELDSNGGNILINQTGLRISEKNKHPEDIAVSCYIKMGILHISIQYNRQMVNGREIKDLLNEYLKDIEEIAAYCQNVKEIVATPSDFSAGELTMEDLCRIQKKYGKECVQDIDDLTRMQEEILFQYIKERKTTCYVVQDIYQFSELPDTEHIAAAYKLLTQRFSSLNTVVAYEKLQKPYQVVLVNRKPEYSYIDISDRTQAEQDLIIKEVKESDIKRGFMLGDGPLFRAAYLHTDGCNDMLMWSCHHIIMDGWSLAILKQYFEKYYICLCSGMTKDQIENEIIMEKNQEIPFSDYVRLLSSNDYDSAASYWDNLVGDCEGCSKVAFSEDVKEQHMRSLKIDKWINEPVTKSLQKLAASLHATVNSVIEASWGVLLQKINNCSDVVFGKTVSGRDVNISGIDKLVGIFINTVAVRVTCDESVSMSDVIKEIQTQANNSKKYDYYPIGDITELQDGMTIKIGSLVVFENYYEKHDSGRQEFHLIDKEYREETNIPLNLISGLDKNRLRISLMFKTTEYTQSDISRILDRFELLLTEFVSNPAIKVKDFCLVSPDEKDIILKKWNQTTTDYPKDKSIVQIFEEQVVKYAHKTAVVDKDKCITYGRLNARANYWANRLWELGARKGDLIAISAERTIETIVGIYSILKVGAAYVPIDLKQPVERIRHILFDCKPKVLIEVEASLDIDIPVLKIGSDEKKTSERLAFSVDYSQADLAYIIYTSGTTGAPKGVMVTQKNVVKLVRNADYVPLNAETVILQTGQIAFDASTFEIWGSGLNAGELHLISEEDLLDSESLKKRVTESKINTAFFTAALFRQLTDINPEVFASFQYLLIGGEAISEKHAQKLHCLYPDIELKNIYGPTETTTFAVSYRIKGDRKSIPIGCPISNTQAYIMQKDMICGTGMTGELCIAGDGVSNGYLNNPDLTAERFVPNPFGEGRMYRTGDLARWNEDGAIEFLGRADEQVKLNGFRIELGEIEHALRNITELKDVVVTVAEDTDQEKSICAYCVSDKKVDFAHIKEILSETLPSYMIPAYFVRIDRITLNRNGKVDRKSLPLPEWNRSNIFIAPRTEEERMICDAFSKILKVQEVSVLDSFFELGGNSIKIIRFINMIENRTSVRFMVKDVYLRKTPERLAADLEVKNLKKTANIPIAEKKSFYLMSSAQKRMYLVYNFAPDSTVYNIPYCCWLYGSLDEGRMKEALQSVIDRHEILRTGFIMINDKPVQKIFGHVKADIVKYEEDGKSERAWMEEFIRPFDLSIPPLIRMGIVSGKEACFIMVDVHHIVCDGMSLYILLAELSAHYNGTPLSDIRQYKDYSEWMFTSDLSIQKKYWLKRFSDDIPVLDMPLDFKRPSTQKYNGAVVTIHLKKETSDNIGQIMERNTVSEYMIFLSAAMILLSKYSGQEDIVIGSPVFTRTNEDTEKMLGMFVNTLPMRGKPEGKKRYIDFLLEVKADCVDAYEHQEFPFEELVDCLNVTRDFSKNPLFDVLLVLQNNEEAGLHLNNLREEAVEYYGSTAKFDLKFDIQIHDGVFKIDLEYCTDIFSKYFADRLLEHFENLLHQLMSEPEKKLSNYDFISEGERKTILHKFNKNWADCDASDTVVERFREQALLHPEKTAVRMDSEQISFAELDRYAKNIAEMLRKKGLERNELVALYADRNIGMIAGILGIMYAGAGYVPINITYPDDRVKYLLHDSGAKIVLVSGVDFQIDADIEAVDVAYYHSNSEGSHETVITPYPYDLAYCIYTSGTTGLPKGVLVEHRSLMNNMQASKEIFLKQETDICTPLFTSHCFDLSMPTIFLPLCFGGVIELIVPEREYDLTALMNSNRYSFFKMTPSHAKMLLENGEKLKRKVTLVLGGETLDEMAVRGLRNTYGNNLKIYNEYGPTEAAVFATVYCCDEVGTARRIPIGKPILNTYIYIMKGESLCGIGVPGEICIGGTGVARGYLNKPELTQRKFTDNPFNSGKLYKTGDVGRWLEDGTIEFIGRHDNQVKIHGYRIELGEIEHALRELEGITDTAIMIREDEMGEKSIHAYYVSNQELSMESLRIELVKRIPAYMVPARIAQIDKIPLTTNGKIDFDHLPFIESSREYQYTVPKTSSEKALCKAFEEVLGVDHVGMEDDFFNLGGDSIKAIRIVTRMRNNGYGLNVKQIMGMHIVGALSREIGEAGGGKSTADEVCGEVELTPILNQFRNSGLTHPEYLTQDVLLDVDTDQPKVIIASLDAIVKHHDMIRGVYCDGKILIRKLDEGSFYTFRTIDFKHQSDYKDQVKTECSLEQKQMDIKNGPLMKVLFFRLPNVNKLFLCLHHICIDGLSWQILLDDLKTGISQIQRGREIYLGDKSLSYLKWTLELKEYKRNISDQEKKFWSEMEAHLEDGIFQTSPGADSGKIMRKELDKYSTKMLLNRANQAYHTTVNELVVSALCMAVKNTTGQNKIFIALEGHGREEIAENLSADATVGWFTSKFPILLKCGPNVRENLIETKETIRSIPKHGIGYGLIKGDYSELKNSISLNYLGVMDSENTGKMIFNKNLEQESYIYNLTGMIDFDCYIEKGRLQVTSNFNPSATNYNDAEALLNEYIECLKEVIIHCVIKPKDEKTISDYSAGSLTGIDLGKIYKKYGEDEVADIYELTPLQEGMLYHNESNEKGTEYVVQHIFKLNGLITEKTINEALGLLTAKHEVLKTAILFRETKQPWQILLTNRTVKAERRNLDHMETTEQETYIKQLSEIIVKEGFDIENECLLRVLCIWMGEKGWKLIWTYHHMIADGWCASVMFGDFLDYCLKLTNGEELSAVHKKIELEKENQGSFADYVKWNKIGNDGSLAYWSDYLKGYEGTTELRPMVTPQPVEIHMMRDKMKISGSEFEEIIHMTQRMKITLNTLVETAVGLVLQRYNHSRDVVFGKVVSGRDAEIKGIENIVGLFINTIPLRVVTTADETVEELLLKMHRQGIDGVENSRCSLSGIQNTMGYKDELVKVLYAFENYYVDDKRFNVCGFEMEYEREQTNYAVTVTAYTESENLHLDILYDPNIFCRNEIQLILQRIAHVIRWLSRNKEKSVEKAEMITEEECRCIRNDFNDTDTAYPYNKTVAELVEQQAASHPDRIAVIDQNMELTYRLLNEKANQVALKLRGIGVKRNDYVAIFVERTWLSVVGIYGILKSGGAYVPIDPDYPEKRRKFILNDCRPKALLTVGSLPNVKIPVIDLLDKTVWEGEKDNLSVVNGAGDLAYLIYTSGTTGNPKGSMIPHRGIVRLVCNTNYITYNQSTVFLQTGSMAFDASTMELWGPLVNGGRLIMTRNEIVTSIHHMKEYLQKYHVTTIWLTSSLYNQMIQESPEMFDELEYLMVGGEKLSEKHVRMFKQRGTPVKMLNGYGPTENTTFTTTYTISDEFEYIPIGRPIANTKVYIMDGDQLCGIGVPGELCTAGAGLSLGYLNRPALTVEKFIQNPFGEGLMYKTGDMAKWLPDGNIAYMGRTDDQIKLHGFRIEIGEVEAALRAIEKIKEAAVLIRGENAEEKALSAYLVSDSKLDMNEIREELKLVHPHYMIPQYMLQIEKIPLTPNGKLDKQALPEIQMSTEHRYMLPQNKEEELLCTSFQEILGMDRVGIYDSFYELGGDSIKAIRIVSYMRSQGFTVTVKEIMNRYTISEIAKVTVKMESSRYSQDEVSGKVLSTPVIKKFTEIGMAENENFYQDVCMEVEACTIVQLQKAMQELVRHHDILRAVFRNGELEILSVKECRKCEIISVNLAGRDDWRTRMEQICQSSDPRFDVKAGPLLKAVLFETDKGIYMHLMIHHLVVDGVSFRILIDDINSILHQIKNQEEIRLPEKTASYLLWTEKLNQYKTSSLFKKRTQYWNEVLGSNMNGALMLGEKGEKKGYGAKTIMLDHSISELLKHKAVKMFHTGVNDIILGALCMTIYKMSGQNKVFIMLEGHGREEIHEEIDISRTVGWFTTLYPVLFECFEDVTDNIVNAKETLNSIPNHGLEYGLLEHCPEILPDIMFNYLGEMGEQSEAKILSFGSGEPDNEHIQMISPLSVSAIILNGRARFTMTYKLSRFTDREMDLFVNCYQKTITQCIDYCAGSEDSFHTISDLLKEDMEEEDIEMLNALFADQI